MARGAIRGALTAGLGEVGLGIAAGLAKNGAQFSDGLINLTYQAAATTGASVLTNRIMGEDAFSHVNIGIGDFTLPIRDGKVSSNLGDHIGNFSSAFSYGRGFLDVAKGNATVKLDRFTLSPRFTETRASHFGLRYTEDPKYVDDSNPKRYKGITTKILERNNTKGVEQRGALFITDFHIN